MFFFPYQIDIDLKGIPVFTYLICALCIGLFIHQESSYRQFVLSTEGFCQSNVSTSSQEVFSRLAGTESKGCVRVFTWLRSSVFDDVAETRLKSLTEIIKENDWEIEAGRLDAIIKNDYDRFTSTVPADATSKWMYIPDQWDIQRMFMSSFTHADWEHLLFNLIFFFAFAVSAELVMGPVIFLGTVAISCVTTSMVYSYGAFGFSNELPTC